MGEPRLGVFLCFLLWSCYVFRCPNALSSRKYDRQDLILLREEVRQMFEHAYSSYVKYAYPYDELRPLTCDGIDTWGSYSLTLIDALDTLAVMGNYSEFRRVVDIVTANADFDANINVSVFETNIRIVGGLLSAHLLSQRAGVEVEAGWPCNGKLLRLAEDVARRLLPAFDTATGMPYGTVNLRHGVPPSETSVTCTAGVGTFILEFATLSRLTGDPIYEEVAMNALEKLYAHRSSIGLFGNHIDVMSGRWTAQDSGIGAGIDSYFEYLVKGSILLGRPELMAMFDRNRRAVDKYLKKNNWYVWASMHKGQVTLPVFQSLEAYWPGVLALIGDIDNALRSMHNYNRIWKQYGFTPEFYNIGEGEAGNNRESYPLRPELAESAMYLYRATGDPFMLDIGVNILRSIQHSARTSCGYATIKDTRDHSLENRMESFFLAETTKYLYLLFDPDNFIHNKGNRGRIHTLHSGRQCILDAGGYIFNTEAHPIDPGALLCCHDESLFGRHRDNADNNEELSSHTDDIAGGGGGGVHLNDFRGEQLTDRHRKNVFEKMQSAVKNDNNNKIEDVVDEMKKGKVEKKVNIEQNKHEVEQIIETWTLKAELAKALLDSEIDVGKEEKTAVGKVTVELLDHKNTNRELTMIYQNTPGGTNREEEKGEEQQIRDKERNREALELLSEIVKRRQQARHVTAAEEEEEVKKNKPTKDERAEAEDKVKQEVLRILTGAKEAIEKLERLKAGHLAKESMSKEEEPTFRQDYYYYGGGDGGKDQQSPQQRQEQGGTWRQGEDDNFSYQIDDRDEVGQHPTASPQSKAPDSTVHEILQFDPQHLLERIRRQKSTSRWQTHLKDRYALLTCTAQPFTTRLTIAGEFLDEK